MFSLNCKGKILMMDSPLVMGILNVNGDSFYPGSRVQQNECDHAESGSDDKGRR